MMKTNELVANLLLQGLSSVTALAQLQAQAAAEGRAVTLDELKQFRTSDSVVRAQLDAAIAAHEDA